MPPELENAYQTLAETYAWLEKNKHCQEEFVKTKIVQLALHVATHDNHTQTKRLSLDPAAILYSA